jgi:hypothetical protein
MIATVTGQSAAVRKVTFRVVTYWKDKRRWHPSISQRLTIGQALEQIIDELPDGAVSVTHLNSDGAPLPPGRISDRVRVEIDWAGVPDEIRDGAS